MMSAAHVPQSLPSFAQAFSNSSLSDIAPISTALPPIQSRPAHDPPRKRPREDPPPRTDHAPAPPDATPPRIKEEEEHSPLDTSHDDPTAPAPVQQPSSKKRRVTLSGPPHGPSTPIRSQTTPVPISPVTDDRDQAARTVHPSKQQQQQQQQQHIVDQRRASTSTTAMNLPPADQLATSKLSRIGRISPNALNRCAGNPVASGSQATQPLTPPPIVVSGPPETTTSKPQPPLPSAAAAAATTTAVHSLPPPPISFARRRAAQSGGRKKKPADILISPRGAGPSDPLAPVIQSAPPVADHFPMAIPRLPLALSNAPSTRRVAGNVPPTPTRFSLQGTTAAPAPANPSTARPMISPPSLSVPIANALVPPTPHALQHPGYSGDKSAFLAPFEVFYDALNDSKQLKSWLSDQLQKSNTLMHTLKQQQEKMEDMVEDLVEKRTRAMREEITMLRQRMESLEEALLAIRADSSTTRDEAYGYAQGGSSKFHQNGVPPSPEPASSYRFPAPEQQQQQQQQQQQRRPDGIIRVTSPGREQEQHRPSASPPVEVTRRPSVSATTHGSFSLNRVGPTATTSARTQAIPERSSTTRQSDGRSTSRVYYSGTYGNGNPTVMEGTTATSRGGDKT